MIDLNIYALELWCADIDDCAQGGKAEKCSDHGTCDGVNPPGSFTCTCNAGYKLNTAGTSCEGTATVSITTGTLTYHIILQYVYSCAYLILTLKNGFMLSWILWEVILSLKVLSLTQHRSSLLTPH